MDNRNRIFEILIGLCVIFVSAWFFIYAYAKTEWGSADGYTLVAKFDDVDGIVPGADVKIGGIKVGSVNQVSVNKDSYMAEVSMKISSNIVLPEDTEAIITVSGLLGGKYINLSPGIDEKMLKANEEIVRTRGSQNIESLISKILLSDNK